MRRVLTVPIFVVLLLTCLVGLTASSLLAQTSPPVPTADVLRGPYYAPVMSVMPVADVPTADVLRGPYEAPAPLVVSTADVLRGPYGVSVPVVVSTADVLRGPYEEPPVLVVATADVLRGPYAPVFVRRGDQPLADVLRGPYYAPQAVAVWPTVLAWILAGLALIALFAALVLDLLRRKRQAAHLPTGARPLGHTH